MTKTWVIDCEGDSLTPTKLHCLAASNPQHNTVFVTPSYDNMRKILIEADILICHNLIRFDVPVLERLLGIKIKAKLVDTLALSWYLYPDRNTHGLEGWGVDYGVPKPIIYDWSTQTQEEYEHRCREDVKINVSLWRDMYRYLIDLYGSDKEVWKLLDYLQLKMHCAMLQERSKWRIDVQFTKNSLQELIKLQFDKKESLIKAMPTVPSVTIKTKPKKLINKDGSYSKLGMDWNKLLSDRGLPIDYDDGVEIVNGYESGNPASPQQLKDWLYSLGWVPATFKYVKNKDTGEQRAIPQINLEHGKGICKSIKILYQKEPNLELLDGLSVLQHRIGILNGFLRDERDGYLKAQIMGLTNTLRFKHTTIVNLPKVEKAHAASIRGALICPDGTVLCGADMTSLEDKIKQHYIFPYDPEFVNSMNMADWDAHLEIAKLAGMMTQEQVDAYKAGDHSMSSVRGIAKNCGYACQYGAGPPRLVLTAGITLEKAKQVHTAYWEMNKSIKTVASKQKWKIVNDQMWLYNPVSHLWYSLRYEKDIFSTLVQGTASYVFDIWLSHVLEEREQLTGQMHDEFILTIKEGSESRCTDLIERAMIKLNQKVKLNRELGCGIQYGKTYANIH